jgi:hypothetical protein
MQTSVLTKLAVIAKFANLNSTDYSGGGKLVNIDWLFAKMKKTQEKL